MKLKDLLDKKASLLAECNTMQETADSASDGVFAAEQQAEYDAKIEEVEGINRTANALAKRQHAEQRAIAGPPAGAVATSVERETATGTDNLGAGIENVGTLLGGSPEIDPLSLIYRGPETHSESFRRDSAFGEMMADVRKYATTRVMSDNLEKLNAAAPATEQIGSAGGFLVQQDVGAFMSDMIRTQSAFLSRARTVTLSAGSNGIRFYSVDSPSRKTGSRYGGVSANWTGEKKVIGQSDFPDLKEVELRLNKIAALMRVPDELMADAPAAASMFQTAVREELLFLVEDSIFEGDGVAKPVGLKGHASVISQAAETGQAADTVVWENLSKMYSRMWTRGKGRGVWLYNWEVGPEMDRLQRSGAQDEPVRFVDYGPTGVLRIKGRPAVETEYCDALGDSGDIVFWDPSQYVVIMGTVQQASSMHLYFDTDEMAFRITLRVDGKPGWIESMEPFKGAAATRLSHAVFLAARA